MKQNFLFKLLTPISLLMLTSCGTSLPVENEQARHLLPPPEIVTDNIPNVVNSPSLLPAPSAANAPELYSVVVQDVSVRELLFAVARDAGVNIDVHPLVIGTVSLNAIDQTLPQILDRIGRQVDIRWRLDETNGLMVETDSPYLKSYRVDYVNVSRDSATSFSTSSSIGSIAGTTSTGGGTNNSTAQLSQNSSNDFWVTLVSNLRAILGESSAVDNEAQVSGIVSNPESGLVTVRATGRQHREIESFLDNVRTRSLYQVLIEATVVEVTLNDRYQAGVDWATLSRNGGEVNFLQSLSGINLSTAPAGLLTIDKSAGPDAISATIRMLAQFGDLRVLSSPKIMALNNQAAMLRVVDNKVYFTVEVEPGIPATTTTAATPATYTSTINTVPVGFTMSVTPQISENDQVTLNVRPTISRIVRYVNDPSPALATAGVVNAIPEIQIRELESILKVYSGQIAILGGLMQDSLETSNAGLPGLSRLPGIGNLFSYRDDTTSKTELIVFIRPVVVKQPSLDGDLQQYREFLPEQGQGLSKNDGVFSSQFRGDETY